MTKASQSSAVSSKQPRLHDLYCKQVASKLMADLKLENSMQIPRLDKIVVSMGLGAAVQEPKLVEMSLESLGWICGQKPVVTRARKSIAGFKLRQGMRVGVVVTLRRGRMWEFFDRFVHIALPRVRDFRGVNSRFDGSGNCSVGVTEQLVFPEIPYDRADRSTGLNVTFVTTAKDDHAGKLLLRHLGLPFRIKKGDSNG
ncbi:MAG: 50S ribosomal protein L5 [Myxococcota bacterium]